MKGFTASEWLAIIAAIGLQVATILGLILTHMDNRARTAEQTGKLQRSQQAQTNTITATLEDGIKSVGLDNTNKLNSIIGLQEKAASEKAAHIVTVVDDTHDKVSSMNTEGVKVKQ